MQPITSKDTKVGWAPCVHNKHNSTSHGHVKTGGMSILATRNTSGNKPY